MINFRVRSLKINSNTIDFESLKSFAIDRLTALDLYTYTVIPITYVVVATN
jgi:hypothetical protein